MEIKLGRVTLTIVREEDEESTNTRNENVIDDIDGGCGRGPMIPKSQRRPPPIIVINGPLTAGYYLTAKESTQHRVTWKLVMYTGIGLGLFSVSAIALLSGLGFAEIDSSTVESPPPCLDLEDRCGMDSDNVVMAASCCAPYVCNTAKCVLKDVTTTTRSEPVPSKCPYTAKLEQILEPVRDLDAIDRTLEYYDTAVDRYLTLSAHRGDPYQNYLLTVRELNAEVRHLITVTTERVGNNVFPLIVATESSTGLTGVGGTFTLYLQDGSVQSVNPVGEEYELRKGISHIPLALFGILVPYFKLAYAPGWPNELRSFGSKVNDTLITLQVMQSSTTGKKKLHPDLYLDTVRMLEISKKFIDLWLDNIRRGDKQFGASKTVTIDEFQKYSDEIFVYLDRSIRIAAELQVKAVVPALTKWRAQLGEKLWRDVYAVIPTIWPVTAINPRFQALAAVMTEDQAKTQVFNFESGGSVDDLRKVLGKIIAHRTAAHLIFGTKTQRQRELNFALSGRQDLMSNDADEAIRAMKSLTTGA